jgi:hypothetical protein
MLIHIDPREARENPLFCRLGSELVGTTPDDPSCIGCRALGLRYPSPPISDSTANLLDVFHGQVRAAAERGESYSLGPIMGTMAVGGGFVSTITCPVCGRKNRWENDAPAPFTAPEPVDANIGRLVAGRHRLMQKLMEAPQCTAYRAKHALLGIGSTVWLIAADKRHEKQLRAAMLRYGRATARIDDPHTIAVWDIGEDDDGGIYLVAEPLEGAFLDVEIAHGPLSVTRAVDIASQLAGVLAVAHERGVVHRALSSANVFLGRRDGRVDYVKLLDFSCAWIEGEPRVSASSEGATPATDLHALGVILCEMLTGRPFESPPSGVPRALEAIVLRLLEEDPERRFAGAREVMNALAAVG